MAKLTDSQVEQIVTWSEKGKWGTWIARRMSIPPATVNYQMLVHGYDPWDPARRLNKRQPNGFSPDEDERMLAHRRAGLTPQRIARLMGRATTSIRIRILTLEVRAEKALDRAA